MNRLNSLIKRLFDILFSILGIVILVPFGIICSILIKLDSPGPVFFLQERLTRQGKCFKMIKFRSMSIDEQKQRSQLISSENDDRITKVGRFIRKYSIDELPQLFNILMGDMSFVGPRPPVVNELGDYDTLNRRYKKRFMVEAGLTGLAQINGRNAISWDERIEFDNEYVDLWLKRGCLIDLSILMKTAVYILKTENIYEITDDNQLPAAIQRREEEIIRRAHQPDEP